MSNNLAKYYLILEACRAVPNVERLQHDIQIFTDWKSLIHTANLHGVLPLVYQTLKSLNLPKATQNTLKLHNLQIAQTNIQMTAELIRVVKLFEQNGITYMALKGPVLSQIIHNDTLIRQYTDLDILVHEDDAYKTGQMLCENGYTATHALKFLKNRTFINLGKDFSFVNAKHHVLLELHWKLFLAKHIIDIDRELFSKPLLTIAVNNTSVKTLDLNYLLIYLCLHGSKHYWERIEWIVDIDRLIRNRNAELNWNQIQKLCKTAQIEAMFYLGLLVAHEMFATPLPQQVLDSFNAFPNIHTAQNKIQKLIYADDIEKIKSSATTTNLLHEAPLKDTRYISLKHYLKTIFQINTEDIYVIDLPRGLHWIYYPIKLFRLVFKYSK